MLGCIGGGNELYFLYAIRFLCTMPIHVNGSFCEIPDLRDVIGSPVIVFPSALVMDGDVVGIIGSCRDFDGSHLTGIGRGTGTIPKSGLDEKRQEPPVK
jgi:hypothetical protein